jgi:hypothetical protein
MNDDGANRGPWYLITALVIGVAMGLVYAWVLAPVQYVDTAPASLRQDYKDQYRAMVAAAYEANHDLVRAQSRLNLLGESDSGRVLTMQASKAAQDGRPQAEVHALGLLAMAISQGISPTPLASPSATPSPSTTPSPTGEAVETQPFNETEIAGSPPPTTLDRPATATIRPTSTIIVRTATPTITPLPTRTPTPTAGAPFVLKQNPSLVCNPNLKTPLIIVEAYDSAGLPVPGVQVIVQWAGREDRFFTGLKPELGSGYGDFSMTPGVAYTVQIAEGGRPVADLITNECETTARERYWGSWKLVFVQP